MTKSFRRFVDREVISSSAMLDAVKRAEAGLVDADLGGGILKQRVARRGEGKSGGYRVVVVFRSGDRAVFLHGFAKNDKANLTPDELRAFKEAARYLLALEPDQFKRLFETGSYIELKEDG
jgi:hypothetical protein